MCQALHHCPSCHRRTSTSDSGTLDPVTKCLFQSQKHKVAMSLLNPSSRQPCSSCMECFSKFYNSKRIFIQTSIQNLHSPQYILQSNKHLSLNAILERLLKSFGLLIIITQAQGYNQLKSILNANQTITVQVKCAG